MPTTNVMTNCAKCQKKTLHIEQKINHILHLLLTIFTAGFWIVAWIYIAFSHNKKTQVASVTVIHISYCPLQTIFF